MRRFVLILVALLAATAAAESKNPADYPLRLHIFTVNGTTFYHNRMVDEYRGDGMANLFENSEPRGVTFTMSCAEKIRPSVGFETYAAKWKKQNEELIVLFPRFDKTDAYFTCHLKTAVKSTVFFRRPGGGLGEQSPESYKQWMGKHEYDPEKGKNTPVNFEPRATK